MLLKLPYVFPMYEFIAFFINTFIYTHLSSAKYQNIVFKCNSG